MNTRLIKRLFRNIKPKPPKYISEDLSKYEHAVLEVGSRKVGLAIFEVCGNVTKI